MAQAHWQQFLHAVEETVRNTAVENPLFNDTRARDHELTPLLQDQQLRDSNPLLPRHPQSDEQLSRSNDNQTAPNNAMQSRFSNFRSAIEYASDTLPLFLLFFLVWLGEHLLHILVLGTITSTLYRSNFLLRQVLEDGNLSMYSLLSLATTIITEIILVVFIFRPDIARVLSFDEVQMMDFSLVLFDVCLLDSIARLGAALLKISLVTFFFITRKLTNIGLLRRSLSSLELVGLVFRTLVPAVPWQIWLGARSSFSGTSSLLVALYIGLKISQLTNRSHSAYVAVRALALREPMISGKYCDSADLLEGGRVDSCAICCQEELTAPVELECSHIFCEECILSWVERGVYTCPLCRSVISLRASRQSTRTSLMPELF